MASVSVNLILCFPTTYLPNSPTIHWHYISSTRCCMPVKTKELLTKMVNSVDFLHANKFRSMQSLQPHRVECLVVRTVLLLFHLGIEESHFHISLSFFRFHPSILGLFHPSIHLSILFRLFFIRINDRTGCQSKHKRFLAKARHVCIIYR